MQSHAEINKIASIDLHPRFLASNDRLTNMHEVVGSNKRWRRVRGEVIGLPRLFLNADVCCPSDTGHFGSKVLAWPN
jgi:hypothetical protein